MRLLHKSGDIRYSRSDGIFGSFEDEVACDFFRSMLDWFREPLELLYRASMLDSSSRLGSSFIDSLLSWIGHARDDFWDCLDELSGSCKGSYALSISCADRRVVSL